MIELLCFILCIIAFSCFAHAKATHYRDIYGVRPNARLVSKILICAWISILLSITIAIAALGSYGVLLFCGFMAVSVLAITLCLSFRPKWLKALTFCCTASLLAVLTTILIANQ
ncbi:DUF3325 domain-containing protein [Pseudoalteromonas sp. CO325X]|uniref:DUF3325 domain-containing protein n=1 Tax=Pseudoalteromonas sp. CO325X TaxID=1777262 RepID=UPI001023D847|nr:DUF3325 domain-containing protein [Pseudoalteromonas sp. CO325X]RZF83246.1 DUF3325 domain-containing protein [Pseudoalteromonas sp. CO325X]